MVTPGLIIKIRCSTVLHVVLNTASKDVKSSVPQLDVRRNRKKKKRKTKKKRKKRRYLYLKCHVHASFKLPGCIVTSRRDTFSIVEDVFT